MSVKLNGKESIKAVIDSMSLREKVTVLTGETIFRSKDMEEYGIPSVFYLDGGTGANYMQMFSECLMRITMNPDIQTLEMMKESADQIRSIALLMELTLNPEKVARLGDKTQELLALIREKMEEYIPGGVLPGCFPPGIVLGATWDPETIYQCGKALAKEAHFYKIDVLLGTPNVNIHRDPRGGRLFEGYSEDPCLVSKLAPEFVKGIQSEGIVANVKHFAANNQETDRRTINEHIPIRALHEIYFPGFKACVQEGQCKTVMSAYNAINGQYCAMNPWLLTEVLREEWGFDGFVVSDWGAAYDQAQAIAAGNDMTMPGPRDIDAVIEAVESGELDEKCIDQALERVLSMILEMPVMKGRRYSAIDREYSRKAAYESIKEGIVLLRNENGTLPLSKDSNVCFYGNKSKQFIESGGGSANVVTSESTGMFDITMEKIGIDRVRFEDIRQDSDAVVITVGAMGQEGFDRPDMDIDSYDKERLKRAIAGAKKYGKKVIVVLNVCAPVDVSSYIDDIDALFCVFLPGMEGGRAAADVLFGDINPSGKLPVTFPKRYRDCPSSGNFPGRDGEVWYSEGIFLGYRYYDYRDIEPRYPFGFGLSYTQFDISDVRLSSDSLDIDRNGFVTVYAKVKNTGDKTGKEVVQLYVGQEDPTLVKPPKELKAFKKVHLEPGEELTVEFTITKKELESYDAGKKRWAAEPGLYHIMIGNSSRHIADSMELKAVGHNPYGFDENTAMGVLAATPGALDALCRFCPESTLTRQAIELEILFRATESLEAYWKQGIEPLLSMSEQEKKEYFKKVLEAMNRYHQ